MFSNIVPNVVLNLVLNSISFYIVQFCEVEVALQIATFWKLYHSTCCQKVLHLGCCSSPRSASALKNLWWSFFLAKIAISFQLLTIFSSLVWSYMRFKTSLQTFPLAICKMALITATSNRNSYIDLFSKLFMSLKPLACHMPATKAVCSYETMAVKGLKIMLWL